LSLRVPLSTGKAPLNGSTSVCWLLRFGRTFRFRPGRSSSSELSGPTTSSSDSVVESSDSSLSETVEHTRPSRCCRCSRSESDSSDKSDSDGMVRLAVRVLGSEGEGDSSRSALRLAGDRFFGEGVLRRAGDLCDSAAREDRTVSSP
jgi:hypothetical protein